MTDEHITLLEQNIDRVVRLLCTDGEVIVAKIHLVDRLDEEIVYDMVSTTDESKYEKYDQQPAYLIRFNEITAVEASEKK